MKISAALPSVAFRRLARRPADLFAFFNRVRIGAKIYAGFCLVLLLLVMIAGASWLGFQETTSGMGTIQESRSEEHASELQSLMRISYAVFCLKKKIKQTEATHLQVLSICHQH